MLEGLVDRLRSWRVGAVTGAGFTENNVRMMGALFAPFLVMWSIVKFFLPDALYDMSISVAMVIWLVWCVVVWAWAKSDANNYIVFPQSKWKFPNGDCRTFDLKVPPDSWEELEEFPDGSRGVKVWFDQKYGYFDPDLDFPRIWRLAYWHLPSTWDISFRRRAFGEFFHKNVYVTKPDCEDISVYVFDWETTPKGETYPVCMINDCAFTYRQMLKNAKHMSIGQLLRLHTLQMQLSSLRKEAQKMTQHTAYLEERVDVAEKDSSDEYKNSADNRMKAVRKRHARVMDTGVPLGKRIIIALKYVAWIVVPCAIIFLAGRFFQLW